MPDELKNQPDFEIPPYLKLVWARARNIERHEWLSRVGGELVPLIIILAVLGAMLGYEAVIGQRRVDLIIGFSSIALMLAFRMAYCLIKSAATIHGEQNLQIDKLVSNAPESPLKFFFDPASHRHVTEYQREGPLRRIGLVNSSNRHVKNVRVQFRSVVPIDHKDVGLARRVASLIHAPLVRQHVGSRDVAPGEECDYDVASLAVNRPQPDEKKTASMFRIYYEHNTERPNSMSGEPLLVPIGCYKIAVEAFADGYSPSRFEFFLALSTGGLQIAPVAGK